MRMDRSMKRKTIVRQHRADDQGGRTNKAENDCAANVAWSVELELVGR